MLYMFLVAEDGTLLVYSASGYTTSERALAEAGGWTFYMTTDKTARHDVEEFARYGEV